MGERRNHILVLIFVFSLSIFILRGLIFNPGLVQYGDLTIPYNNEQWRLFGEYTWDTYTQNQYHPFIFQKSIYSWLTLFSPELSLRLLYIVIFTLIGLSMYYLIYIMTNSSIASILAALFYIFNPIVATRFQHRLLLLSYASLPIYFLIVNRALKDIHTHKNKNLLKYAILIALLLTLMSTSPHWTVFSAIVGGLIWVMNIKRPLINYLKKTTFFSAITGVLYISLSAFWIFPYLHQFGSRDYLKPSYVLVIEVLDFLSRNATLLNVIRLHHSFAPGALFQAPPLSLEFYWLITLLVPVIAFSAIFFRRNKFVIMLSIFALGLIFLGKGTKPPFGEVYAWIVFDVPIISNWGWLFRDPHKWSFLLNFVYSLLIGITLSEIIRKLNSYGSKISGSKLPSMKSVQFSIILVVVSFIPLFNGYPLLSGDLEGNIKPTQLPRDYAELHLWMMIQDGDFKIAMLPEPPPFGTPKPTIRYNFYWTYCMESLLSNKTRNLGSLLSLWNVKYLVVRTEVVEDKEGIISSLVAQSDLEFVRKFGALYVFRNRNFINHISISDQPFLLIGGLDKFTSLTLIDSFNPKNSSVIFFDELFLEDGYEPILTADGLVMSKPAYLDLVISSLDEGPILKPFDYVNHHNPQKLWSKAGTTDPLHGEWRYPYLEPRNIENWDFDYGMGIVFTWASSIIDEAFSLKPEDLISKFDFENETLGNWSIYAKNTQTLFLSEEAYEGNYCLKTELLNSTLGWKTVNSPLIPAEYGDYYKWDFYIKGENAHKVHTKLVEYDENKIRMSEHYMANIGTGNFPWRNINFEYTPSSQNASFISLEIWHGHESNQSLPNTIWLDNIRVYNLMSYAKPNTLEMPFKLETARSYDLYIRYFQNKDGGKIALYLDRNPIEIIDTKDQINSFVWKKVGSYNIDGGKHNLIIENQEGFNAVNLFALIPEEEATKLEKTVESILQNKRMIYILEAESDLYNKNTKKSNKYGGAASNGEVLELMPPAKVWKEIEILKPGNYTIVMRGNGNLNVKIDEKEYTANSIQFGWTYIGPVSLEKGKHRIEITTPVISFQWGFDNYTLDWTVNKPDIQTLSLDQNSFEGNFSLKTELLNSTWGWKKIYSPHIPVEYGKIYKSEFYVKGENVHAVHTKIIEYDENNTQISATRLDRPEYNGNFTWQNIDFEYTPSSQNASYVQLQIWHGHNTTQSLPNKIWIDNVRVTPSFPSLRWDFEYDTQGWTVYKPEQDTQILGLDQNSFEGNYSLKTELLNSTWGWKTINSPLIPAEYGNNYKWEFYVKGENAYEVHAKIVEYDENTTQISATRYPRFTLTGNFTWRNIDFDYTPSSQNASYVQLQIWHGHNTTQSLPNKIWIDNVRVTPSFPSLRWDFEYDTQGWTVYKPEQDTQILGLDQNSFEGNYSLKTELLNSTWGWKTINSPLIPVEYGNICMWEFYVKGENTYEVHAKIVEYDENTTQISTTRYPHFTETGNFTWQNISFDYTPSSQHASYVQLQIWHGHETNQPLPNTIWIDNVRVDSYQSSDLDVIWIYSTQKENETLEDIFTPKEYPAEIITYQNIDPTKYVVKVNAAKPFMLSFSEAYDPLWKAYVNGKQIESIPLYSVINGFWINQIGELTITIEYEIQRWFYYGSAISITSLIGSLTYILWDWKRKHFRGSRLDKIISLLRKKSHR